MLSSGRRCKKIAGKGGRLPSISFRRPLVLSGLFFLLGGCVNALASTNDTSGRLKALEGVEQCQGSESGWPLTSQSGRYELRKSPASQSYAIVSEGGGCIFRFSHSLRVDSDGNIFSISPSLFRISELTSAPEFLEVAGVKFQRFTASDSLSKKIAVSYLEDCPSRDKPADCIRVARDEMEKKSAILSYIGTQGQTTISFFDDVAYFGVQEIL